MAVKTITARAPCAGTTSDTSCLWDDNDYGREQIKYSAGSFNWGWILFDISDIMNKPSATYITEIKLSYDYQLNNDGSSIATVRAYDKAYAALVNATLSGTTASGLSSTTITSTYTTGEYNTKKNTGWQTRSAFTLSLNGTYYPKNYRYLGINLTTYEDNGLTHMTAYIRRPRLTISYNERYTATFNENNGNANTQKIVDNGAAASFYTPSRQYHTFKGWKSSINGTVYTSSLPAVTDQDVTYTAQWERNKVTISWNLNGGFDETANTSTPSSITMNQGDPFSQASHIIAKTGYKFTGWDQSYYGGLVIQDSYRGYTTQNGGGWQISSNADYSTKYKLSISKTTSDNWNFIQFGNYNVAPNQEIIIRGQVRLINMPAGINLYHGEKPNDYNYNLAQFTNSSVKNEWLRFEIKRTNFSSSLTTGCFEIYTSNLNGISGTLEFDLREVEVIYQNQNICPLKTNAITSNLTFSAYYREKNYVAYDSYFNYKQFKDLRINSTAANGGTISDITDIGFTMNSTSSDCYTWPFSPMFYLEKDKQYIISFYTDDVSNSNIFTFYYTNDGDDAYNYSLDPNSKSFSGAGKHEFTFTAKSPYCRFRAGTTVNGNIVKFYNFCVRPAGEEYNYMESQIEANDRCNVEATLTFPTPTREHYSLKGWNTKIDGSGTAYTSSSMFPTKNLTLWSQWEIDKHKATFLNYDGTVFKTLNVDYGSTPNLSDIPTKPDSERYHYDFSHWQNLGPILEDTIYTPVFTPRTRYYKIIWQNYDGTKLEEDSLPYEEIPVYEGPVPTKPATAQYTFTWSGWNIEIAPVTANITYTATYAHTTNTYDVTWKNWDGTIIKVDEDIPYGDVPVFDYELPTKDSTAQYSYTFFDWDSTPGDDSSSGVETVKGHITYTATYTAKIRSYNLNLTASEENSGQFSGSGVYEYGSAVAITTFPKPGYAFIGWSDGVKDRTRVVTITGEATYTAIYKKISMYLNTIPIKEVYLDTINITDSIHMLPDLNIL